MQVENRSGRVLYENDELSVKSTVEVAVALGANLGGANLRWANLGGANLSGANLGGANLRWADLSGANLGGANLGEADLSRADLSRANLGGANLRGANLGGANLSGANLGGANLRGADLSGANLGGANLSRANLSRANLRWAKGVISIGPIGSRGDYLYTTIREGNLWLKTGCFYDDMAAFEAAVAQKRHGQDKNDYLAAIVFLNAWFVERRNKS